MPRSVFISAICTLNASWNFNISSCMNEIADSAALQRMNRP
jgi:hypothetical protein